MAGNKSLNAAAKAKQDEFYTQLSDIEDEMRHYRKHFAGKTVLCNCDDPFESNFFKYFVLNFNRLKLKKLIATCYTGSPVAGTQLTLFDVLGGGDDVADRPYKAEVTSVRDATGDGGIDMLDVAELIKSGEIPTEQLQGDGDFRSEECLALMDEADIVVTNPPFSLFREYVATLMERGKKFIIIGNQNAITYKEIFPLLMNNEMWLGYKFGDMAFTVPDYYEPRETRYWQDETGQKWRSMGNVCWYTNLDIRKRHEELILVPRYDAEKYPKYDNYDAIEVSKVAEIPFDYEPGYLVPVEYKPQLADAGFVLGSERRNSSGEMCVCVCGRALAAGDCAAGADGVLQRPDGRADNVHGQAQSGAVRACGSSEPWQGQRVRPIRPDCEWEAEIQEAAGAPFDAEWCNGVMGVPITFMDKYNPGQFEVLGLTTGRKEFGEEAWPSKRYQNAIQHNPNGSETNGSKANTRATILLQEKPKRTYYTADNADGPLEIVYARILVRRKTTDKVM